MHLLRKCPGALWLIKPAALERYRHILLPRNLRNMCERADKRLSTSSVPCSPKLVSLSPLPVSTLSKGKRVLSSALCQKACR